MNENASCILCGCVTNHHRSSNAVLPYTNLTIREKVYKIVNAQKERNDDGWICSRCVDLVETFDAFERKLEDKRKEILSLFQSSSHKISITDITEAMLWDITKLKDETTASEKRPGENQCFYCLKIFKSWEIKLDHVASEHLPDNAFTCKMCLFSSKSETEINRHSTVHNYDELDKSKSSKFECQICGIICVHEFALLFHIRQRHVPLECYYCDKKLKTLTAFRKHLEVNHGRNKAVYTCTFCSKTYKSNNSLRKHIKSHPRNDVKKVDCDICKRICKTELSLAKHKANVHSVIVSVECKDCGIVLDSPSELQRHRNDAHRTKHPCPICRKEFFSSNDLSKHQMRIHRVEKSHQFICEICSKSFAEIHQLKVHMKIHGSERQHSCKMCDKAFKWASSLDCHIRAAHNDPFSSPSLYVCQVCNKNFKEKNNLRKHSFTHSDKKPHQCQECGKGFIRRDLLQKHLKNKCRMPSTIHKIKGNEVILQTIVRMADAL